MPPIIEVKNLTKEYNLGTITNVKDSIRHTLAKLSNKKTWQRNNFKALNNINFTVNPGEVVGIIGHNGAGKSTLLKHLANITKPTSGEVNVRGSLAPLIEVGAGVNPELTGRENIFLNGAILGIPKKIIQTKLDEIIDFSELDKFIDTPVKRYSSGMTVKLGFSIATSMDADILIIDEVLAVGDLAFQRKCFDRMETLIRKEGKTVLLVSHNIRQVTRMCSRVILLNKGEIIEDGDPERVASTFYKENNAKILLKSATTKTNNKNTSLLFNGAEILSAEGKPTENINPGDPLNIRIKLKVLRKINKPEIVIGTHTTDFVYLTGNSTDTQHQIQELLPGSYEVHLSHSNYPLKPGVYGIRLAIFDQNRNALFSGENLAFFSINITHDEVKQPPMRLLDIDGVFSINKLN